MFYPRFILPNVFNPNRLPTRYWSYVYAFGWLDVTCTATGVWLLYAYQVHLVDMCLSYEISSHLASSTVRCEVRAHTRFIHSCGIWGLFFASLVGPRGGGHRRLQEDRRGVFESCDTKELHLDDDSASDGTSSFSLLDYVL